MSYQNHIPDNLTTIADNARLAENLGFSALWVRDVPFYDPHFGDVGQGRPDGYTWFLSAHTQNIALGTAGLIAPLRSPIHIAKMATSVDSLSHGRFYWAYPLAIDLWNTLHLGRILPLVASVFVKALI